MSFLLDTVMPSELREAKPSARVVRWSKAQKAQSLFVSVVSIGEIERGIVHVSKTEAAFAAELDLWLEALVRLYDDNVLPVTADTARLWGRLSARIGNDSVDLLIAATALTHGLTVVTRDVKHFTPTGVAVIDPFGDVE